MPRVTGEMRPTGAAATYAVVSDDYKKGGFRPVADIAARDAITTPRKSAGMRVFVEDVGQGIVGTEYELAADETTWIELPKVVDVKRFGAKGDAVLGAGDPATATDDTVAINDALQWVSTYGWALTIGPGRYRTTSSILLRSNTLVIGDPNAWIEAHIPSGIADFDYAIVRNFNTSSGIGPTPRTSVANLAENITLKGLNICCYSSATQAIGLALVGVHNVLLEDVQIERTYANWATAFYCKNLRSRGFKVNSNTELFEDGIHVLGGEDIQFIGSDIHSGDDSIAVGWDFADVFAKDILFDGAVVNSQRGYAFKCFNPDGNTTLQERIIVANVTGKAGQNRNGGIFIFEQGTPSGRIKNVTVSNVKLQVATGTHDTVNPFGLWTIGGVDLQFNNVAIDGADGYQLKMENAMGPITFNGCTFEEPENINTETAFIYLGGLNTVTFNHCTLRNTQYRNIRCIDTDLIIHGCRISAVSHHIAFQASDSGSRSIRVENSILTGTSTIPVLLTDYGHLLEYIFIHNKIPAGSVPASTPGAHASGLITATYYEQFLNPGISPAIYNILANLTVNELAATNSTLTGNWALSGVAPIMGVTATNGNSGLRLNVTGINTALLRLQNAGVTFYQFGAAAERSLTLGTSFDATPVDGYIRAGSATGTGGAATISIASPAVITKAAHGLVTNRAFTWTTTGALPTGFATATTYYVLATGLAADSFQASLTPGGAAVDTSGTQSGTHTLNYGTDIDGGNLFLASGAGTGSAAAKGRTFVLAPVPGASGTTAQAMQTNFTFEPQGQITLRSFTTDPTTQVADAQVWYRSDSDKVRTRANGINANLDRWSVRASTLTTVNVTASDELVTCNNVGATVVNLPAGILNQRYKFKNIGAGTATLTPNGAETLFTTASVATLAMVTGDSKTIQFDGTYWLVL